MSGYAHQGFDEEEDLTASQGAHHSSEANSSNGGNVIPAHQGWSFVGNGGSSSDNAIDLDMAEASEPQSTSNVNNNPVNDAAHAYPDNEAQPQAEEPIPDHVEANGHGGAGEDEDDGDPPGNTGYYQGTIVVPSPRPAHPQHPERADLLLIEWYAQHEILLGRDAKVLCLKDRIKDKKDQIEQLKEARKDDHELQRTIREWNNARNQIERERAEHREATARLRAQHAGAMRGLNNRHAVDTEQLRTRIQRMTGEQGAMQALIDRQQDRLNGNVNRKTVITWKSQYLNYVRDGTGSWEDVWKLAKKESNICQHLRSLHPMLVFRGQRAQDLAAAETTNNFFHTPIDPTDTISDDAQGPLLPTSKIQSFEQLPTNVQLKILGHALIFDKIIHAISRLDEWVEPSEVPEGIEDVRLLHRFHIGSAPACLTHAIRPEVLLAPLSVCRSWNVMGYYVFYGLNTFAFSSLGEWGRFGAGIGVRLQRLQSIELLWKGTQHFTYRINRKGKFTSRRTSVLVFLKEAINIKSLKIHVQESNSAYMRGGHEPKGMKRYLKGETNHQPNYRGNRSLRNLQGIGYVYALRGLKVAQFYDFDLWLNFKKVQSVRDFSFVVDVGNAVFRSKSDINQALCQWRQLTPTVHYTLTVEFWEALEAYMESKNPVPEPQGPPQPPGHVPVDVHPIVITSDSGEDSGVDMDMDASEDEDDDDDEGDDDPENPVNIISDDPDDSDDSDDGDSGSNGGGDADDEGSDSNDGSDDDGDDDDDPDDPDLFIGGPGPSYSPVPGPGAGGRLNLEASRSRTVESGLFVLGHTAQPDAELERSGSPELFVPDDGAPSFSPNASTELHAGGQPTIVLSDDEDSSDTDVEMLDA